ITGDGGDESFSGTMRHRGEQMAARIARAPEIVLSAGVATSSCGTRLAGRRPSFRRAHQLMRVSRAPTERRWLSLHEQNLPISYPHVLGSHALEAASMYDAECLA